MKWVLYNLLFVAGFVLMLPRFLWRMAKRGGYRDCFLHRFGVYGAEISRELWRGTRIWVHAVSVGEMGVALDFVKAYREADGTARFILSTTTSTGFRLARERKPVDDVVLYFPLDLPVVVRRVLLLTAPKAIVLVEGELWPNFTRLATARRIPVFVINGRMTESSFRGYRMLRYFFGDVLRMMRLVLVQTEADAARYVGVGAGEAQVRVTGNAKYDGAGVGAACAGEQAAESLSVWGAGRRGKVLVGGSTWPGEERVLVELCVRLRAERGDLRLVLVPRHAERGDAVEAELRAMGIACARRSVLARDGAVCGADVWVLLVDTTGELRKFYAGADLVFVGKSLTAEGGQNMIEPAALGKPVVVGPNTGNFAGVMRDLLAQGAIEQVPDAAALEQVLGRWLADETAARAMGRRAAELVERNRGTLRRNVELVRMYQS